MTPEPFIGEIGIGGFNFAPRGWAFCNGQILSIAQNTALFSLIGTTFGGNGQTTFALPDLRGRVPISEGQGPGLSAYTLGEQAGQDAVTLTTNQMPAHSHGLRAAAAATTATPGGAVIAPAPTRAFRASGGTLGLATLSFVGGSQPHENRQPLLALNYCIALEGIYPSRS